MHEQASRWRELDLGLSDEAREMCDVRSFFAEFDTDQDRDDWKEFLYNPLAILARDNVLEGEDLRVVTTIVNHHKPLNPRIGLASVTVSDKDVGISIVKIQDS